MSAQSTAKHDTRSNTPRTFRLAVGNTQIATACFPTAEMANAAAGEALRAIGAFLAECSQGGRPAFSPGAASSRRVTDPRRLKPAGASRGGRLANIPKAGPFHA